MKKIFTLIALMVAAYQLSMGQAATSANVAIGSSYVNNAYVDVYPYQSAAPAGVDKTVHFKLNIGTRFKINEIKDAAGTIEGYIITPWKYTGSVTSKKGTEQKAVYYDTIAQRGKRAMLSRQQLKDSVAKKEAAVKAAKDKLLKDSLNLAKIKSEVTSVQAEVEINRQAAFQNAVRLNAQNVPLVRKNDAVSKMHLNAFTGLQSQANSKIIAGVEPDTVLKEKLIAAVVALPLKNSAAAKRYSEAYHASASRLNDAKQAYEAAKEKYKAHTDNLKTHIQELTILKKAYQPQSQPATDKPDPYAYKITKEKINDKLDTPADTADQAAIYDELAYLDSWANGWLFFISAKDFSDNCVLIYPSGDKFTWGFLTLPVKIRFDNSKGGRFDFEQNLNFGLTFGDKHQLVSTSDISLNYLLGLSIVNVPLDDATPTSSATSTAAVSTSIGLMLQYDKFQIGAFLGNDFAGAHASQFKYQGKPWLGFAIGISLFGEGKTTGSAQTQDSGKP
ncbi:MAG: hypothetical protein ACXVJD_09445 [Mucilaginibacter sp.]